MATSSFSDGEVANEQEEGTWGNVKAKEARRLSGLKPRWKRREDNIGARRDRRGIIERQVQCHGLCTNRDKHRLARSRLDGGAVDESWDAERG